MENSSCVLVCLSGKKNCLDLIKAGNALAIRDDLKLNILLILPQNACFTPDREILNMVYEYSKQYNAELNVLFDDCPSVCAAKFAKKSHAFSLVVGKPDVNSSHFISEVHSFIPEVPINLVKDNKVFHISDALMSENEIKSLCQSHKFI